jgi:hypothetical protein
MSAFLPPIEKPNGPIMNSERDICEIVLLVASEHLCNMTNIGLYIHSDMLCDINRK